MTDDNPVILTARDFTLLENLVQNWGEAFPGASEQISRKLDRATIVFPEDLPPGVVVLNSRVRFRVGMAPAEERTIVADPAEAVYGMTLTLASPRAVALIGGAAGQTVQARRPDGTTELLFIEAVPHQGGRPRPCLKIVSSQDLPMTHTAKAPVGSRVPASRFVDDDDPGPSAA